MTSNRATGDAVVVPAIATGSSLACIRSLGRRGVKTIAVSERASPPSAHSKYCDEFRRVPSPWTDVEGYKQQLLALARRNDVRTIVPVREPDIYVLSRYREEFGDHIATPWKPYESVRTVQDRVRLFEAADRAGVSVPETALADEWDRWDDATVVKSRHSITVENNASSYAGVRFFDSDERPDVDALVSEMGHVPLAQEFVPGDSEYGFFALYDRGEPVARFQHRRIRSYSYAGGASVFRKSVYLPELEAAGMRLLDELDWHGPAMVEFKRDPRDGEFKLMEINPRFWGSLALSVASGVDFPYRYFQLAGDELPPAAAATEIGYEEGVGCHVLSGELSYLYSLLDKEYSHIDRPALAPEIAAIARSLVTDPNFDYLDLDDPEPFVSTFAGFSREAGSLVRGRLADALTGSNPIP